MENKEKHTKSAGGVVVNDQGEVIVVNQQSKSWSLPKGHIESGEDAFTAAKREIYEETGVKDLELVKELGTYERYKIKKNSSGNDYSELKVITLFLFKTKTVVLKPIDPENPEARWVPVDKVADLLTHQKDKDFFESIIKEI